MCFQSHSAQTAASHADSACPNAGILIDLKDCIDATGVQEMLQASLKATMSRLAMPICITAYTTDPAAAVPPTEVAPGIFCARQAPDVAPPPQMTGDSL
jgi:hypothetical protein